MFVIHKHTSCGGLQGQLLTRHSLSSYLVPEKCVVSLIAFFLKAKSQTEHDFTVKENMFDRSAVLASHVQNATNSVQTSSLFCTESQSMFNAKAGIFSFYENVR